MNLKHSLNGLFGYIGSERAQQFSKSCLNLFILTIYFSSSCVIYADTKKTEKSEEDLWKKIISIINLEYGMLSHEKVESIFGNKLELIKKQGNSYQYLGRSLSDDYFTVLVTDQKNGTGGGFIFQWETKIDIDHSYIDVTKTPAPKHFCIRAFDRKEDIKGPAFLGRSNYYFNDHSISYLTFKKTQIKESTNTEIHLDEESDCLLKVEVRNSLIPGPDMIP